jgi:hypothetical protein
MDFICVGVRIPKCGSTSLSNSLKLAFAGRRIFHLPHTLDVEGGLSFLQTLRFRRSQARNLFSRYRTIDIGEAYGFIDTWALDGDLILGGHIDFFSVQHRLRRPVKMITLFREPIARCRSEYNYCRAAYRAKTPLSRLDTPLKHRAAGLFSFQGYLDFLLEHSETYGNLAARYVGWNGRENLDRFFARHVFHSGVLENSAAFTRGLARKMGMPLIFPHDNKSKGNTATIGALERAKIERLCARDFQLYEWQLAELAKEEELPSLAPTLPAQAMMHFALAASKRVTASAGR